MRIIEKENGQIFEACTSLKEFASHIKDVLWAFDDKTWTDEDSSLYLKYKSGKEDAFSLDDKITRINFSQIACGAFYNPGSIILYNLPIVYNKHYEDWEVQI
jgi:hypothetical protein